MQYQADERACEPAIAPGSRSAKAGVTRARVRGCASCAQLLLKPSQKCPKFKRYKTNAVFHSMTAPSAAPAASATGEISDAASASDWRPSAIATNGANDVLS